ncbi:hypothetical protein IU433_31105 [Nocardia puris]|uniref:Beta-lactamase family protein n=1 Tax=Nocardia puris TaxID=208602 RepID=A0A366E502_9NOCA|nr:hypothetical protein [Nocardia puris]MBF6215356.1 hypothetical protein [Nocardia puris]MBF6369790.1 hypothetical protein [Nocardia puris]MBF6463449.1 hypothetical protein [Nocardia puris]RBO96869.1 hypothetical protein DFR74_101888 [Nocardia puris]
MASDEPGRLAKALGASALAVLLLTSCGTESEGAAAQETTTTTRAASDTGQQRLQITVPGTLAHGFQELTAQLSGTFGMAVMPVGGERMVTFGDWTTGPAWSTMKVPLVIAAQRDNAGASTWSMSAAITSSDNAAADALWQGLGTGQQAAQAVEAVLREGGDQTTVVPATRSRAEHSAFGQAEWSLSEQVRFASRLPCLPQSDTALNLMGQIIPNHRWGLGQLSAAEFKGGWGPDASGAYLVRQFGVIDIPTGRLAVAFAAQPDSGAFADGMNALNRMATLLSQHLGELTGGSCPP